MPSFCSLQLHDERYFSHRQNVYTSSFYEITGALNLIGMKPFCHIEVILKAGRSVRLHVSSSSRL